MGAVYAFGIRRNYGDRLGIRWRAGLWAGRSKQRPYERTVGAIDELRAIDRLRPTAYEREAGEWFELCSSVSQLAGLVKM